MLPPLTPTQIRKLKALKKSGPTRNPGNITTMTSLSVWGFATATKIGTFPHAYMEYSITEKGLEALREHERGRSSLLPHPL